MGEVRSSHQQRFHPGTCGGCGSPDHNHADCPENPNRGFTAKAKAKPEAKPKAGPRRARVQGVDDGAAVAGKECEEEDHDDAVGAVWDCDEDSADDAWFVEDCVAAVGISGSQLFQIYHEEEDDNDDRDSGDSGSENKNKDEPMMMTMTMRKTTPTARCRQCLRWIRIKSV